MASELSRMGMVATIMIELRERLRRFTGTMMSRCRVCGSSENVIGYDPRGLWAYFFRRTWCPEHCPEHEYNRHRDGFYCDNCSEEPPYDWY